MAPPSAPGGAPGAMPSGPPPTPEQMAAMMAAMMLEPMVPPPPGVTANLDHPESRINLTLGLCSAILFIMLCFVVLRLYTKTVTKQFGKEDWACLFAAIMNLGYAAVIFIPTATGGLGKHIWEIRKGAIMNERYFKSLIAANSLYYPLVFFTKLSIFLLIYRLFKTNKRAYYQVYFGMAVTGLFYSVMFILTLIWCAPAPGGDPMLSASKPSCMTDANRLSSITAGFNIASDIYLLIIPIPVVWGLKTSMAKRVRIIFIFALGLLATALSAVTLYYRLLTLHEIDTPWIYVPVIICSIYEVNLGVICACLPTIPALMKTKSMQSFLSLRTWSLFSSRGASTSGFFKKSNDSSSHKRSEYSDITALKSPSVKEEPMYEMDRNGHRSQERV
ncbi:hypothetical protein BCR34DRAFT_612646 [Clohesyomyces aquaticus]|uniref:Rhodopsin domain-containing protein n=1 Tax=Clohesyomyces aquaticus TaxID=1231657 RepID=A0A1Y1ZWV1_9PLEO|nr:hypothetical protein BCR34DRAFT_612646 [Clohesyomyces aquaticus]